MHASHYRMDGSGAHQRRSQRVVLHGALIALTHPVEKGQILWLTNRATKAEQLCKVMYLGPSSGGKSQIGIEFTKPCPDFWRIAFPPEDWTIPDHMTATSDL
jgi:hypothetical protein